PAVADGERDRDVSHRVEPAALAQGAPARSRRARARAAPAPQGVPALPRPEQLADAARGAAPDGPRRPDRQRQAPARAVVAAGGHRRAARGPARPAPRRFADPAHGVTADAASQAAQAVMRPRGLPPVRARIGSTDAPAGVTTDAASQAAQALMRLRGLPPVPHRTSRYVGRRDG